MIFVPVLLSIAAVLGISWLLLDHLQRSERFDERSRALQTPMSSVSKERVGVLGTVIAQVARIGRLLLESGLLSGRTRHELSETLRVASFGSESALPLFIGFKLILAITLPLLAFLVFRLTGLLPRLHLPIYACAIGAGLMLPDFGIRKLRARTLARLDAGLPDALDLLVICAEAGLALEPAISRVGVEIAHAHPAIAEEFGRLSSELQLISDPRVALRNIGQRTGLIGLKRLASTLAQSIQYGTPLAHALRVLAGEMRRDMLLRFEERAAKLPVMLTLPMIIFILPTIFLVVGGPAAVSVMRNLHH